MGRIAVSILLLLWTVSAFGVADARDEFAQQTGLDRDLVNLVQVEVAGTELTITFVYINDRTFQSKISPQLSQTLWPFIGRNAIYVNPSIDRVVSQFGFNPLSISVIQDGATYFFEADSWYGITPGFLSGAFEVNPSGPSQGSGSEGILILDDAVDAQRPFELSYGGVRASLEIGVTSTQAIGSPTATIQSHDPIEVTPLQTFGTLEALMLHEQFSAGAMAAAFELDPQLVRTITISPRGNDLRLLLIRLEPSVRASLLGEPLLATLDEVIGTGAVAVWAVSPTGADFTPWNFYIRQNNSNYVFFSAASFVELTEEFLRVEHVAAGAVAAGVIRLPRSVDAAAAFSVFYGTSGVDYP